MKLKTLVMGYVFICLGLFVGHEGISAVRSSLSKSYVIESSFEYRTPKSETKSGHTMLRSADDKSWTAAVPPREGIALLGRITSVEGKNVAIEYMLVDTNNPNGVVYHQKFLVPFGERAEVTVGKIKNEPELRIAVLVKQPQATK